MQNIKIILFTQVVHQFSHNHLLPLPQYIPKEAFFLQREECELHVL